MDMKGRIIILLIFFAVVKAYGQSYSQKGIASFYADKFEGRRTANGEKYKHNKLTAAHKTLPFGTIVRVKNLENGKEVDVRINDRGPFVKGRIIDLSKSAAKQLDFINAGIVAVEITTLTNPQENRRTYSTLDIPSDDLTGSQNPYYSLEVKKQKLKGFGVQIGSFQELVNLVELADDLKRAYKYSVFVQVADIQGVKYYKLIIGDLKTSDKADRLKTRLSSRFPDCFVFKL